MPTLSLLQSHAPINSRWCAVAFAAMLFALAECVATFGTTQGPVFQSFVPMAGLLWCTADLLTAYLLASQFRGSGDSVYLVVGAAYLATGLLTIPYVVFFPGTIASPALADGTAQVSITLWAAWHIGFPIVVGIHQLFARAAARRYADAKPTRAPIVRTMTITLATVATFVIFCWLRRATLPVLVEAGHFTALFSTWISPAVVVTNVAAAAIMLMSTARPSALQVWLGVALISEALDGFLNAISSGRYSLPWYAGKVETIVTASVVLGVLLTEVSSLYSELGRLALIDTLTGLRNRRAFDDCFTRMVGYGRRSQDDLAFLIADIDFFKSYNDCYGHAAGDECLRRVAAAMSGSIARDCDILGRYGGEEFVILLPVTTLAGAIDVAERVRKDIEAMRIPHERSTVADVVTVSIGVCATKVDRDFEALALYRSADRALYLAKITRNSVASGNYEHVEPREYANPVSPAARPLQNEPLAAENT